MTRLIIPTLLGLCLALAGCQEDLGRSAAAAPGVSYLAEQREQQSMTVLKQTLGQPTPDSKQYSGWKSTVGKSPGKVPTLANRPTLNWTPPATREDGSGLAIGEIRGYRLYYRLRHQKSFVTIDLEGPDATRFSLAALPPGAYEFAVTTLDQAGLESRPSAPVIVDLI